MLEYIKSKVDYHSVKNARKLVLFVNIANTFFGRFYAGDVSVVC